MRLRLLSGLVVACSLAAAAQQAAPPVQRNDLPPSAILLDELSSFDRVRSDMANWSEVELAAFRSTTTRANADCARVEQTAHEGEEALALARLCAIGLDWDGTYSAAKWYTRTLAPAAEAQHLPTGFALLLKADLNLGNTRNALDDLNEMQARLPLSDDTDSIFEFTINTLEVMRPEDALKAATVRETALLDAVAGRNPGVSAGRAEAEAWHVLSILHTSGKTDAESAQKALLLQAVAQRAVPLAAADQYAAQRGRAQYGWLGRAMAPMVVSRSTYPAPAHRAAVPLKATLVVVDDAGAAGVPAMGLAMDSLRTRLAPGAKAQLVLTGSPGKAHAVYTGDALLETFAVASGPLFLVLDGADRVVWMGTGSAAWLNPQQQAEVLLARVMSE